MHVHVGFEVLGGRCLAKAGILLKLSCVISTYRAQTLKAKIAAFFNEVLWAGSVMLGSHPYWTVTGVAAMDKFPIDIFCAGIKVSLH